MTTQQFRKAHLGLILLGAFVVVLGAYTRLTDSGLGCPDWPGCYGKLLVPNQLNVSGFDAAKAWAEMIHRYVAGFLGLGIFTWAFLSIKQNPRQHTPYFLVLLVILQAAFGAWTVTWKLHPLAVMPHLMGGMTITSLLWLNYLPQPKKHNLHFMTKTLWLTALACVIGQCIVGGWTSANYAALICPDFPTCQGGWPLVQWQDATNLQLPIGQNHEGGLLGMSARISIHMLHRYLGFMTGIVMLSLVCWSLYHYRSLPIKRATLILLCTFTLQALLGALNVLWALPLSTATLHNGIALGTIMAMIYFYNQAKVHG